MICFVTNICVIKVTWIIFLRNYLNFILGHKCSPSQEKIDPAKLWLKIPIGISYLGFRVDHYTLILDPKAWQFLLYSMHTFILQSFIPIMPRLFNQSSVFSVFVYGKHFITIKYSSAEFWILNTKTWMRFKTLRLHWFIATWTSSTNTHYKCCSFFS